jgi:UDP-N-acetylmuramate dehydrogenase
MNLKIEKNIPLCEHTTLKVGGVADSFVEVKSEEDVRHALQFAEQTKAHVLILGGGSNLLVKDTGFRGLVIKNSLCGLEYSESNNSVALVCGAGEVWDDVVQDSVDKGYWGLENLSAIPGKVGATPVQNVGAYGVEVSSLITSVSAINIKTLELKEFSNDECLFGYRDSYFKTKEGRDWIITSVTFKLSKNLNPQLSYASLKTLPKEVTNSPSEIRKEIVKIRSAKFPDLKVVGTAGSFFKNPIIKNTLANELKEKYPELPCYEAGENLTKVSLGWILDNVCNLKAFCRGGVCLYKNQALVLVNESATSAEKIDEFADFVAQQVEQKTGIKIEREVSSV